MPTYEYRCPNGHEFEKFQRITEPPVAQCPACGKEAIRMLSGGAGLLFKGGGFYITDYRSDSYKKAEAKEKPDSGGAGASDKAPKKDASGGGSKGETTGGSGSSSGKESA